jgi:uncharacterized membrane protein YeaQ/YmgE (transglycosylase-associated protein family)
VNVIIWLLAGAAAGSIASSILHFNVARAVIVAMILGIVGAVFGGEAIAPQFGGSIGAPGVVTPFGVLVASISE